MKLRSPKSVLSDFNRHKMKLRSLKFALMVSFRRTQNQWKTNATSMSQTSSKKMKMYRRDSVFAR